MTIRETAERYGTSETVAEYGDTLWKLSFRIYGDDSPKSRRMLTELNVRYDWDDVEPGAAIVFLDPKNAVYASELDT